MRPMLVSAIFIGEEGSMGYKHGITYQIRFSIKQDKISIQRPNGTGVCPYDSLKKFLENWNVIG